MSTVVLFQRWQYSTLCLEETKCDESQLRIVIEHVFWTLVIMLPKSAHADGDDGEEVTEASDDKDQDNVGYLNIIRPRFHPICLPISE